MSTDFGAGERELLEGRARALYHDVVAAGALPESDLRLWPDHPDHDAADLLIELGLIARRTSRRDLVPVDPSVVQSHVVVPLGQRGAELLEESSRWAEVFAELGQEYRTAPARTSPVTELRGVDNINRFLQTAVADTQHQMLTAQPSSRKGTALKAAQRRDRNALQRGVKIRTLYQHAARRSAAIRDYVAAVRPYGAEVRTLDEFFNRLIICDQTVAIVPGGEGPGVAIAVRDPGLIAYLSDMFERYWERALDYADKTQQREIADEVRGMTVRMLVEGHSDLASAKRIGVSPRTYAGYIRDLKKEHGVETRFQLGYLMGQQEAAAPRPSSDDV